jgi:hypothetical protein
LEHQKLPQPGEGHCLPLAVEAEVYPRDLLSPSGCGSASHSASLRQQ